MKFIGTTDEIFYLNAKTKFIKDINIQIVIKKTPILIYGSESDKKVHLDNIEKSN